MERWRGLRKLVEDAVEHGSRAVEHIQKETMRRPLDLLERIPPIATPVKGVRLVHDTAISSVHGMIRLVNKVVGETLDVVIDVVEHSREHGPKAEARPVKKEESGEPRDKDR